MPDLFEELRLLVGGSYVSDLRYEPYRSKAKSAMKKCELTYFSLHTLSEMAEYLYGTKQDFQSVEQAKLFFSRFPQKEKRIWHSTN